MNRKERLGLACMALLCSMLTACTGIEGQGNIGSVDLASQAPPPAAPIPSPAAVWAAPPPLVMAAPPPPEENTLHAIVITGSSVGKTGRTAPLPQAAAGAMLVKVYYATDRQFRPAEKSYGWQPNRQAPHLSYGSVLVSVPKNRAYGRMPQSPWWHFNLKKDAKKYMLIQETQRWSRTGFLAAVKERMRAVPGRQAAFIYIHGYSNSFTDAALRTAQMAVDLDVGAMPVFYSWPSKGELAGYIFDQNSVEWTQIHLQDFLADFADHSTATDIYIIAHSMGNRPATIALTNLLEKRPELLARFKQVILAAPDINAEVFREQIAPRLASLGLPVTLYASKNDKAIRTSYQFAGWDRIGDIRGDIVSIPGLDFIDASNVTMNFVGHDYVASNRALLTDIATMIKTGGRAKDRGGLRGKPSPAPRHWEFP